MVKSVIEGSEAPSLYHEPAFVLVSEWHLHDVVCPFATSWHRSRQLKSKRLGKQDGKAFACKDRL